MGTRGPNLKPNLETTEWRVVFSAAAVHAKVLTTPLIIFYTFGYTAGFIIISRVTAFSPSKTRARTTRRNVYNN